MLIVGFALGVASRLFGYIHSKFRQYFFTNGNYGFYLEHYLIYSKVLKESNAEYFPFCIGMLITYYIVAFITDGVYSNIL